jgi:hypothetical protein
VLKNTPLNESDEFFDIFDGIPILSAFGMTPGRWNSECIETPLIYQALREQQSGLVCDNKGEA